MRKPRMPVLLLGLLLHIAAHAHGEGHTAHHDGQLIGAGDYTLEWVAKDNALYISDHDGNAIATEQASGKIVVVGGGNKASIVLAPAGGNRFTLSAPLPTGAEVKAVISITLPGRAPVQARLDGVK